MIRRELPLTTDASPAEAVANFLRGFSFVLAPAAADPVLESDNVVHALFFGAFSLFGKFLLLFFRSGHTAICCLEAIASAWIPMAQIKPNSSRATAVMVFL
jgi:hypothetical protein